MALVLTAAAGLAVGLSLMIWALTERRARYRAELAHAALQRTCDAASVAQRNAEAEAAGVTHMLTLTREELRRARAADAQLRADVIAMRDRLRKVQDPVAIRQWLEDLLKVESLEPKP